MANKILLTAFKNMVESYNNKEEGINYTDVRDFENYILSKGISREDINKFLK